MHIVWVLANSSSAPYFNWFAEKAQLQNEFKFSFICMYHEPPKMVNDMKSFGASCYWIQYNSINRKMELIKSIVAIYKLLRKIKPDIVHTHLFDDSFAALLAAKLAGVKRRFITKGDTGFHYFYTPKWILFDRLNNYLSTDVIAISRQNKRFIEEVEKAPSSKTVLIHHGVPIEKITNQNEEIKNKFISNYNLNGKIVIGTISRLIEWKGHNYIIEAASTVVKQFHNVVFVFIGQGEIKNELENKIREHKIENFFIFINRVEPENIPSLYGIMDLYLHAASYEPFGFVIAEAILNGVPIVSTNTGAAADILVNNENGIIVPEKNSQQLANGIVELLKDRENALKMAAKAKERATNLFDFNIMWSKYTNLYSNKSI